MQLRFLRSCALFLTSTAAIFLALSSIAKGQTDPANFDTVINVPPDIAPNSIGSSTQLNLSDQGVIGEKFLAGALDGSSSDVEVNISGGTVGDDLSATGSTINISGGTVGRIFPKSQSVVNITGGAVGGSFSFLGAGSIVNLSGGSFETRIWAQSGSILNVSGGSLGGGTHNSRARTGSIVNMTGGRIQRDFVAENGSQFELRGGSVGTKFLAPGEGVVLFGGEFELNGLPYMDTHIKLNPQDVFSGTLADGSAFVFSPLAMDRFDNVSLQSATLPVVDPTPKVHNSGLIDGPIGLRKGQTLTLQNGGALGDNFTAVEATLNIQGGTVGESLEVVDSSVAISGGTVGSHFHAYSGSNINMTGGRLADLQTTKASSVNISGGIIEFGIESTTDSEVTITGGTNFGGIRAEGSVINISGGTTRLSSIAFAGSEINISGGTLSALVADSADSVVRLSGGTVGRQFIATEGSQIEISGGEFKLNGNPYTSNTISLADGDDFTGTLADGSVFIMSDLAGDAFNNASLISTPLPDLETSPIIVDSSNRFGPAGLRPGQSLVLRNRGILPENFAVVDATLDMQGGLIRDGMEIVRSKVDLNGGLIGSFAAYAGSEVNVDQARIAGDVEVFDSVVNFNGLTVDGRFEAQDGSIIEISGGRFTNFRAESGSVVNVYGGDIGQDLRAESGSSFNLFGTEFYLDGEPLEALSPRQPFTITDRRLTLSGLFADGTAFSFDLNPRSQTIISSNATLTVTLVAVVPEPKSMLLLAVGCLGLAKRRRSDSLI